MYLRYAQGDILTVNKVWDSALEQSQVGVSGTITAGLNARLLFGIHLPRNRSSSSNVVSDAWTL